MKTHIALLLVGLQLALAAPAFAVHGRDYIERERRINKMTKNLVEEQREVQEFGALVMQLDGIDLSEPTSTRDFWRVAQSLKDAMAREVREGNERLHKEGRAPVQDAGQSGDAGISVAPLDAAPVSSMPLDERVRRMEMIMLETDGLRNPVSMNERSVLLRYRHLVGEFHALLQADINEMQSDIAALREIQRATAD